MCSMCETMAPLCSSGPDLPLPALCLALFMQIGKLLDNYAYNASHSKEASAVKEVVFALKRIIQKAVSSPDKGEGPDLVLPLCLMPQRVAAGPNGGGALGAVLSLGTALKREVAVLYEGATSPLQPLQPPPITALGVMQSLCGV